MFIVKYGSKIRLLFLSVFIWLVSLKFVFLAYIVGRYIEAATSKSFDLFIFTSIQSIVGFFTFAVIGIIQEKLQTDFVASMNKYIKSQALQRVLNGRKNELSNQLSFFTTDLKLLEENGINSEISMIDDIFTFLSAVTGAFVFDFWTSVCFLGGAVLPLFISKISNQSIHEKSETWSNSNNKYTSELKDTLRGLSTIRNYSASNFFYVNIRTAINGLEDALRTMDFSVGFFNQIVYFCTMVLTLTIPFGVGIYRTISGAITLSVFMSVVNLSNSLSSPIIDIQQMVNEINTTMPIRLRLEKILKRNTQSTEINLDFKTIKLSCVSIRQEDRLKPVSLEINKGDRVLVQGPSGAGKTTLLRILSGELSNYLGTYSFNDHVVNQDDSVWKQFAYCEQNPVIFGMSIRDNITLGENVSEARLDDVIRLAELDSLKKDKGLDYLVKEDGINLSGGQRQRIGIARALLHSNRILLIDEGTSALNVELARKIRMNYLNTFKTVIEVAHWIDLSEKEQYNKVIQIK